MEKNIQIGNLLFEHRNKRLETFGLFYEKLPSYKKTLEKLYLNPSKSSINLGAFEDDLIVGGAFGGHLNNSTTYCNFFLVFPESRTCGLGSRLLASFESQARGDGQKYIECEVMDSMVLNWFLKKGYVEIQGRQNSADLLKIQKQVTLVKSLY